MSEELSPSQVAARLGTTTRTVQRWIEHGTLPARRVGGRWRVADDAIVALERADRDGTRPAPATAPPIRRLFVANRGEIANRIRRTGDRLGLVRSSRRRPAPTPSTCSTSAAVVSAARAAAADAVHPGFGFLAENAAFAEAVERAAIRWIGPPPEAIRAMGDKAAARRLAASLGVPVIPGYDEADQSDAGSLPRRAHRLPDPRQARGRRRRQGHAHVRDLERLPDALAAARREAGAAFGDDRLILERLVEGPRHVEVQVLFDAHGQGVHLGERDCSIQRRHQKVLEETPSPGVDAALRARLGEAALTLAGAVGYVAAGTVEFLLDDRGAFHFLEMNTRLQVEHPVTELVTGRTSSSCQLRIAEGRRCRSTRREVDGGGRPCGRGPALRRGRRGRVPARDRAHRAASLAGRRGHPRRCRGRRGR